MPLLVLCVQEPELSLKRVAASALSDIAKHTPELAQGVVDAGLPASCIGDHVLFEVTKDEAHQLQQAACLLVMLLATCMPWEMAMASSLYLRLPAANLLICRCCGVSGPPCGESGCKAQATGQQLVVTSCIQCDAPRSQGLR